MKIRHFLLLSIFLYAQFVSGQIKTHNFGVLNIEEKNFSSYDKEPSANAVVLYEKGNYYYKNFKKTVRLVKEYHVRIKILKKQGYDEGTIQIPVFFNERLEKLEAITHDNGNKYSLLKENIYTQDHGDYFSIKQFTFPNMKVGCIIEYKYSIVTPAIYSLGNWEFQSNIPKLYSEFNASIPNNIVFDRAVVGGLTLDTNEATLAKDCFSAIYFSSDCEVLKYTMKNIPSWKSNTAFLLGPSNYVSRLEFRRKSRRSLEIEDSWKIVDRRYMMAEGIGVQLTKNGFLKRKVPSELFADKNSLEKAKKIYQFVQKHYTWDNINGYFGYNDVRKAFKSKSGSIAEINMTLINLLNEADIPANLMLLSTRKNGLPKKSHPVLNHFNYFVARTKINGKVYWLDASNPEIPFGILPFKALNHYGRVMDFDKPGFWEDIEPYEENLVQIRAQLKLAESTSMAKGTLYYISTGYEAISAREDRKESEQDEIPKYFQSKLSENVDITSYQLFEKATDQYRITEKLEFEQDMDQIGDQIYINPFLLKFFKVNPFISEKREYPIDFGYPRRYKFEINIEVPDNYVVSDLPKPMAIELGEGLAQLNYRISQSKASLLLSYQLKINKTYFKTADYEVLKKLFDQAINIQDNTFIILGQKVKQDQ